jgi:riboflavin kinase/FMN adenylyltransferase
MRVHHDGGRSHAAGYVGVRPTFGEDQPVLEAYLLDFSGNLYGKEVEAEFIAFLRPDQVFASPEALAVQMRKDTEEARAALESIDADDPIRRFPLGRTLARTSEAI